MDRKVERRRAPLWRRPAVVAIAGVAVAAVLLWRLLPASGSTDIAAAQIETGIVSRAPFADYLPVRAAVAPKVTTLVGVLSGGQVEKLLVQDGAMVSEGQPLASLANPELRLDVLTREAQIASQLGGVAGRTSASSATASTAPGRLRRPITISSRPAANWLSASSFTIRAISPMPVCAAMPKRPPTSRSGWPSCNRAAREAGITATQGARLGDTRSRLESNLAAVRASLDALTIRAPMGGRLTNFTIQPGQALKPGDPAGQVDSEGSWKLTADVDEYYLRRVAVGQTAIADGARLTVSKVLPAVKDGRFRTELDFAGAPPAGLNRGQTLDIRITLGSTAPALVAPVGGWLEAGGGSSVFVLDADGAHARRRAVKTGRRNPEQVEILSGLQPGERIVTSNTSSVTGDILNIR